LTTERRDWHGTHFHVTKDLALYTVTLLRRIVEGETISIPAMIQEYALSSHGLELTKGTIRGLRTVRSEDERPSPFQKMGLNSWHRVWGRLSTTEALASLKRVEERITRLESMPTRALQIEPVFEDYIRPATKEALEVGQIYSRNQLIDTFHISDGRFYTGVFPFDDESIWLFVTERKKPDMTQYVDHLRGDILEWDGQTSGRTDSMIINHKNNGKELLLFYRETKDQYPNSGHRFEGLFEFVNHSGSSPTHFILRRVLTSEQVVTEDIDGFVEEHILTEGLRKTRLTSYYERRPELRVAAIKYHGTKCKVCGFEFDEIYGLHGAGYIEVHHLVPLSEFDGKTKVDPKEDMTVVCSNCHRMIHRRRSYVLSPEELRKMISLGQHDD
jgi:hypothetical protein